MKPRTYTPLPAWPPAALALCVLIAGYIAGPLIALLLTEDDQPLDLGGDDD